MLVFEIRLLDTRSVVCLKAHEHAASYYRRMFDFVTLFTTAVHCLKNSLTVSIAALHLREVRATGTLFLRTWWRYCLTRFFVRMRFSVFSTFIFKKPCESLTSFPHDEACVVPTSSLKCEISDYKRSEVLSTLGEHMTACVFPLVRLLWRADVYSPGRGGLENLHGPLPLSVYALFVQSC